MTNPNQWLLDLQAQEQRKRDELPAAKAAILAALKTARIASIAIDYNGDGDSGQIESITATSMTGRPMSRPLMAEVRPGVTLRDNLSDFAWQILDAYHDGFENNDGGCGEISIDVAAGTVTLDHNDRFTDVINTTTEV